PDFGQTLSFSIVGGTGATVFRINRCSGQVELLPGGALNYETTQWFGILVLVQDDGIPSLNDSRWYNVTVDDANEPPVIVAQNRNVSENAVAGTIVGVPLVATDVDRFGGNLPWYRLNYSITGGNDRAMFSINNITGQISIARNAPGMLDFENGDANRYLLTA